MKNIDKIVENFLDTGKIEGEEVDDLSNIVDDEELQDVEYIKSEYGWLKDDNKIKEILKSPPFDYNPRSIGVRTVNGYRVKYILTNEFKNKNFIINFNEFKEFIERINTILHLNIQTSENNFRTYGSVENQKDLVNNFKMSPDVWSEKKKEKQKALQSLGSEEVENRVNCVKEIIETTPIAELPNSKTNLFRSCNIQRKVTDEALNTLIEYYKDDIYKLFYLRVIGESSKRGWDWHIRRQQFLKTIIEGVELELSQNYRSELRRYVKGINESDYLYVFSKNGDGKLMETEKNIIKPKIEKTYAEKYEESFTLLGFNQPESKGGYESLIHDLHKKKGKKGEEKNYNVTNEIVNGTDSEDISNFIINNIIDYMKDAKDIIKYDIIPNEGIKDNKGKTIIPKESKIEVKKIINSDHYFSEFLASPVKSGSLISSNDDYRKKYNKIISSVYEWLVLDKTGKKVKNKIKSLITNDLEGMIIDNNIYVPNNNENIEFYLSNKGQNNKSDVRLTLRYNIDVSKYKNFYRLGDGIWEVTEGIKSKKGILYPLENDSLIKGKERQITENSDIYTEFVDKFLDF